jgi:hypothetical protein
MPLEGFNNPRPSDTVSPSPDTANRTAPGLERVKVNNDILSRNEKTWSSLSDRGSTTSRTTAAKAEGTEFVVDLTRERKDRAVVNLPTHLREVPREIKLQEWEGQVQEVDDAYFLARLVDLAANETEETEEVQLPLSDVTESDRALVVPGAVFRWIIGYRYIDGVKERFARVVIRRLPVWTEQEIRSADKEALELHDVLISNDGGRAASTRSG